MTKPQSGEPATTPGTAPASGEPRILDEALWAEFEYALWQLGSAFARWRRDCLGAVTDVALSGSEASILHAIHMNGTAKGLMEISRLLHRDDLPNLQYGLKKLSQLGLVEKRGNSRRTTSYVCSARGAAIIEAFIAQRRASLLKMLAQVSNLPEGLEEMIMRMHLLVGIYDQSADMVRSHQPS